MEIDLLAKLVESSPVIVLIVLGANIALWRKLDRKDAMLMTLQAETLKALSDVTGAVRDLKAAIERRG
jgi:hypothetical protein